MDKARIDKMIPKAYSVLLDIEIANDKKTINKGYRGQISSFGAAVSTGSLLSAVSFFSAQGDSKVKRDYLMYAIYLLLKEERAVKPIKKEQLNELYEYIKPLASDAAMKERVLDAAIALKLAMNLFEPI